MCMHTQQFELPGLFTDPGIPCLCLHHSIVIPEEQPRSLTVFGQPIHIFVKIIVTKSFKDHYLMRYIVFFNPGNHIMQHVFHANHIIIFHSNHVSNLHDVDLRTTCVYFVV